LATSSISVLVVDDSEPFRRVVCSILQSKLEFRTIVEVSDGVKAIELAQAMQPDLILLDIGLPKLNGIEAARRIRELAPQSKILFVSQESSVEVVQTVLTLGASGYVVKKDAGSELLNAVHAVLRGERFVGNRFAGHSFIGASDARASEGTRSNGVLASFEQSTEVARHHEAGFYSDDRCLLEDLTEFIGAALMVGNAAIIVATESHRDSLLQRLQTYGSDIAAALEQGRYISLDAADTLSTFMLKDMPDPGRFLKLFGSLIATAAEAARGEQARVSVFGEMCHLLWAKGNAEAAIQVEKLGNQLAKTYDVDILCGYSLASVQGGMDSHIFQRICAEHSAVHSR
jgi:DNA-binding NarL/FixJ family response regulator